MKREVALKILDQVKENYNKVAVDFSNTRKSGWEEFKLLANYVHTGDRVLDLGCGNGRLVELFRGKPIEYTGIDNSERLIEIANKKYPNQEFILFDGLHIPFKDNYFDAVYCMAVFHHIPGRELRQEFLTEVRRVLKSGGRLILTVWNLSDNKDYLSLLLKFTLKKIIGKSELDFFDIVESWFGKAERYLHIFRRGELKKEISLAGLRIEKIENLLHGLKYKNLDVIAKK